MTKRKYSAELMPVYVFVFRTSAGPSLFLHIFCLRDRDLVLSGSTALDRAASWAAQSHRHEGGNDFWNSWCPALADICGDRDASEQTQENTINHMV